MVKHLKIAQAALVAVALSACGGTDEQIPVQPVVVYEALPSEIPASLVSESFEATQTSEFGDSITLAGTARNATKATVVMVTWDTNAYAHDITLNLYHPNDLVHPFATRTQRFEIPARPPADPFCSDSQWLANDGCHHGYAFPITFDLTGVTLPDSFVFGIAYNTQHYGGQPTNQPGSYDSLNVGLILSSPRTGTRAEGTVYQNSSWQGAYEDGGPAGSFRQDSGWKWHVPAEFVANP